MKITRLHNYMGRLRNRPTTRTILYYGKVKMIFVKREKRMRTYIPMRHSAIFNAFCNLAEEVTSSNGIFSWQHFYQQRTSDLVESNRHKRMQWCLRTVC